MNPDTSAIETFFQVTVYHKCSLNQFTLNDITNQAYEISATGVTPTITIPVSTVTGNTAGCTLEYTIEVYNP